MKNRTVKSLRRCYGSIFVAKILVSRDMSLSFLKLLYSATGVVTLLSGQPKEGVSVEARSDSGFYEQSLTDSSGTYRLRGLLPGTTYTIRVARKDGLGSSMIERASPDSVTVQVFPLLMLIIEDVCFVLNVFLHILV